MAVCVCQTLNFLCVPFGLLPVLVHLVSFVGLWNAKWRGLVKHLIG